MTKRLHQFFVLMFCMVCLTLLRMHEGLSAATQSEQPAAEMITIGGESFKLELANDERSRTKGLGGREEVDLHGGMLFIFPKAELRTFWMMGCKVDIDILFLDADGKIVAAHKMKAEPAKRADESEAAFEARLRRYSSLRPAQFAVELRAGSIDRLRLKVGQTISFDRERMAKTAK